MRKAIELLERKTREAWEWRESLELSPVPHLPRRRAQEIRSYVAALRVLRAALRKLPPEPPTLEEVFGRTPEG